MAQSSLLNELFNTARKLEACGDQNDRKRKIAVNSLQSLYKTNTVRKTYSFFAFALSFLNFLCNSCQCKTRGKTIWFVGLFCLLVSPLCLCVFSCEFLFTLFSFFLLLWFCKSSLTKKKKKNAIQHVCNRLCFSNWLPTASPDPRRILLCQ